MNSLLHFKVLHRRHLLGQAAALVGLPMLASSARVLGNESAAARRYGFSDGLSLGIWPNSGPRGLVRLYAPYLDLPALKPINYIAIEPVVRGARALPEIEKSLTDGETGTHIAVLNDRPERWQDGMKNQAKQADQRLVRASDSQSKAFSVWLVSEPMRNGAQTLVEAYFDPASPYTVQLTCFASPPSAMLDQCILTSTMGNFARLRSLSMATGALLIDQVYDSSKPLDSWGFLAAQTWPANKLPEQGGDWVFSARADGKPLDAALEAQVPPAWQYRGKAAEQFWRVSRVQPWSAAMRARVNARRSFWPDRTGQSRLIPGGASFENVELEAPFVQGQSWVYGIKPLV